MEENKIIIYQTEDGVTKISVTLDGDTVWLSQAQMAELFQRDKSVISKHIANIFEEGELDPASTVAKFATVQQEGERTVTRDIDYYNLDVIISVGYRVKSLRGTQFRIWANRVLKEYMIKGFAARAKSWRTQEKFRTKWRSSAPMRNTKNTARKIRTSFPR